jgi:hypothetical protein
MVACNSAYSPCRDVASSLWEVAWGPARRRAVAVGTVLLVGPHWQSRSPGRGKLPGCAPVRLDNTGRPVRALWGGARA